MRVPSQFCREPLRVAALFKGGISMFEIFGAVLLAGVIVALAATGVVATIFAGVAVA